MANNSQYRIIDEPETTPYSHLVVDPTIIIFAAIFVPIAWMPPFEGRYWMPLIWFALNGFFLGSATLVREVSVSLTSLLLIGILMTLTSNGILDFIPADSFSRYQQIFAFAALCFAMIYVGSLQTIPFGIHKYLKDQRAGHE